MDPTTNNGSFELPARNDGDTGAVPGWVHPGGPANFKTREPGYLDGATDGAQSLNVVTLAGWNSDVLTNSPLIAGQNITMSVDTGWDSWVNTNPSQGSTYYLYAVDPSNFANLVLIMDFVGVATNYGGAAVDAGWTTASETQLIQGTWNGWYTQVVVASGGTANNMVDNFVITQTPEPATLGVMALGTLAMFTRRR